MKKIIASVFALSSLMNFAFSQSGTESRKKEFNISKEGLAIDGYDPVSYFLLTKPVKGKKDLSITENGITYLFSSRQNEETFRKNPSKYEPQFGGWCAYAMGSNGTKVEVDVDTYKILDGKLYLFYNKFFNNTLRSWNKDEMNLKKNADANWAKLFHQ
ncbi:MAG TPA: YHS domain-containing (seleno)protein [Puia sp.]|nr:YHS domain-containing (seleno)protein [Puia sp.]